MAHWLFFVAAVAWLNCSDQKESNRVSARTVGCHLSKCVCLSDLVVTVETRIHMLILLCCEWIKEENKSFPFLQMTQQQAVQAAPSNTDVWQQLLTPWRCVRCESRSCTGTHTYTHTRPIDFNSNSQPANVQTGRRRRCTAWWLCRSWPWETGSFMNSYGLQRFQYLSKTPGEKHQYPVCSQLPV